MSDPNPADIRRATGLFRLFQHRMPKGAEIIQLGGDEKPIVALLVGNLISLSYKAVGDGENYMHDFAAPLPKLYVNADGTQAYFIGGSTRFTSRGFIK